MKQVRGFFSVKVVAILCLSSVAIGAGQVRSGGPAPMAEAVFRDIQVLRGIPVDEFMATMSVFSAALGLTCTDCHNPESGGEWARYADDNELKQTARRMVLMVQAINRTNFGGQQQVTCYSCHRGDSRPKVTPSLVNLYGEPPDEPDDIIIPAPFGRSADEIFATYIEALGGAQRVSAITSFVAEGTYQGYLDPAESPVEIHARAPAQRATIVHTSSGPSATILNGTAGWRTAPEIEQPFPVMPLTGQELEGATLEAQLAFPADIQRVLRDVRVGFPTWIEDREVDVVQGKTAGGALITLYFDRESGLLVRMMRYSESPVGRMVTQLDYDDYREIAGVKMPFHWVTTWLGGRSTYQLSDMRPNVAIDPALFAEPAG